MKKIIIVVIIFGIICGMLLNFKAIHSAENKSPQDEVTQKVKEVEPEPKEIKQIDDWRLVLVNYENILPEDFEIELASIDEYRQFDKRAIEELFSMQKAMKQAGIYNLWVQSSYRSVARQTEIFNNKVDTYMSQGKTREKAEELTLQTINKPGTSEHNLGLAVDFNYVDYSFDKLEGFKWLTQNAENYGFILRYRKDKENITKVNYEPWHWRYVGKEHAKKINELDMCLEEYIDYLRKRIVFDYLFFYV